METSIYMYAAAFVAIASEVIAIIPALKSNSVLQLIMAIASKLGKRD